MAVSPRAACLTVGLLWAAPAAAQGDADADAPPAAAPAEAPSPTLPEHPDLDAAKAAYNEARYNEASRRFLALAQDLPEAPALYRALARARIYADDVEGAVRAYRLYLQIAPKKAGDREKVAAELALAERRLETPLPADAPGPGADALAAAVPRATAGRFAGPDGAFGALEAATEAGFLGPELARARAEVAEQLTQRSKALLDQWWAPDQVASADDLAAAQAGWSNRESALGKPGDTDLGGAMMGLHQLAKGDASAAAETLGKVAPGDPRLRVAQAIALAGAGRRDEAIDLLDALRQTSADAERVTLLWAVLRKQAGAEDATEALLEAVRPPE